MSLHRSLVEWPQKVQVLGMSEEEEPSRTDDPMPSGMITCNGFSTLGVDLAG